MMTILSGCNNSDAENPDNNEDKSDSYIINTIQYKTINGVDQNLLSLDIYHFRQTTPSTPVVIWVHGGGWVTGDKSNQLNNKLNLFSSLGYLFVSINYRLSPSDTSFSTSRIMYPTHNEDVADAVKWVYDNVKNFGGNKEKIVIMGHSAGAHLVSLTGTSSTFLPARGIALNAIKGIVSIDTEGYDVSSQAGSGADSM
jgi:acetyl esterase/lipase